MSGGIGERASPFGAGLVTALVIDIHLLGLSLQEKIKNKFFPFLFFIFIFSHHPQQSSERSVHDMERALD